MIKEFNESKSDMFLFQRVLALNLREKKYMSWTKISRYRQSNAWRMEITTCTCRKLFQAKQHFQMDPSARKLQEPGNKQYKIKEN